MKRLKLPPLFAIIISLQMIFSPFAGAQSALDIMNMAGSAVGMLMGGGQQGPSPQTQAQLAILRQQARPVPDKYFNQAVLARIPGLVPYLTKNGIPVSILECPQLPAKPAQVRAAVCTDGLSGDANNPNALQSQMFEADAYKQAYTFLEEEYDSYLTTATSATKKQGIGCMEEARQIMSGFFQYRMNELDSLVNKLEAINKQFEDASKADLNAIEEITALLEGGGSELYNEVKSRSNNQDLFDYSKKFQDPACSAMFTPERFNDTGLERGFNGINKLLKQTYETPVGKYSAQSFPQAAAAVETDIKNMATKVATQARLNFKSMAEGNDMTAFIRGLRSNISSTTGSNASLSADLFADVQTAFLEKNDRLRTSTVEVINELRTAGVDASAAVQVMADRNSSTFDSAVVQIENDIKNQCLMSQLGSVEEFIGNIHHENSSKFANQNNPKIFQDQVEKILLKPISFRERLKEIEALEARTGNRYTLKYSNATMDVEKLDASGNIVTERVNTKDIPRASQFLSKKMENCDAIYKRNTLKSMSAQKAVSTLRNLRKENEQLAENTARELQNAVTNKLLECPGETAGNTAGSCDPSRFNNASPGFCARVANVCAGKMRACTEQTKQFVATQKVQRDARKKSYNTQMAANKLKVIALFDATMAQYKLEADAMNAQFGIGFTPPTGILREVPEGSRYLGKIAQATSGSEDGTLLLEDPKQFVRMFTANVEKLKNSVKAQQDGILGNGGIIGNHINTARQNMTAARTEMRNLARECNQKVSEARRQFEENQRRMAEEQNRRNQELGEQRGQVCALYTRAQTDANGACSTEVDNTVAGAQAVSAIYGQFRQWCDETGFNNQEGSTGSEEQQIQRICLQYSQGTATETNPTGNRETDLKNYCADYQNDFRNSCPADQETIVGTGDSARPVRAQSTSCLDRVKARIVVTYQQRGGNSEERDAPELPADCVAGDNSGRFSNPFGQGLAGNPLIGGAGGSFQ